MFSYFSFILCLILILVYMVNTFFLPLSIVPHPNGFLLLLNVCYYFDFNPPVFKIFGITSGFQLL